MHRALLLDLGPLEALQSSGYAVLTYVPASSVTYIATDGGLATSSTALTGFSIVDVAIFIDGAMPPNAAFRRVLAANTTGLVNIIANWSFSLAVNLSPGSHTIEVRAALAQAGASATVSGDNNSALQGELTVTTLRF
jgi:hypothetical protein